MAIKCNFTKSEILFDRLVENGIDFLKKSVSELKENPKYSVINFYAGVEIFFKARLMLEHWSLIVTKPENANLTDFCDGNFHSVNIDEAIKRLEYVANEEIKNHEKVCFKEVKQHRNRLVHFFHTKYTEENFESIVSEQCKAWFYLYRLLIERWGKHFTKYRKKIKSLNKQMAKKHGVLKPKFEALKPEINEERKSGIEYNKCPVCEYKAAKKEEIGKIQEINSHLYKSQCLVCGWNRLFLHIKCPKCREIIMVKDFSEGENKCNKCHYQADVRNLLSMIREQYDPKETPKVAYCICCEYTAEPTVIPFNEDYLCLSCLELYSSVKNCGWCHELIAGINSNDTYFNGCVLCKGRFGWDSED